MYYIECLSYRQGLYQIRIVTAADLTQGGHSNPKMKFPKNSLIFP